MLLPTYFYFFAAACSNALNTIQTEPVLVDNTLARNFIGLKLSVKFLLVGHVYVWSHPNLNAIVLENFIYNSIASCINSSQHGFQVTCRQFVCENSTYIISSLTLMFPLDNDVTFSVFEEVWNQIASIDIQVKGKLTII